MEERVRIRSVDGVGKTYYHTLRRPFGKTYIQTERIISPEEYEQIACRAISMVEKKRFCFLYENQYFELDKFSTVSDTFPQDTLLLEIKLITENQAVSLPPFLKEVADVSHNPAYKNQNLAVVIPSV